MAKVLLVDDEVDILSVLSEFMEMMGQDVKTTSSPHEALEIIANEEIEIVISDYEMPEMNGFDLACEIKKIKDSKIKFYLLSGYTKMLTPEHLEKAGITRVLAKPFNIEEIEKVVNNLD